VPPTERKGRVHTSTVTVAIIDKDVEITTANIPEKDLRIEWYSGTGAGGQNRNKVKCSCRLTHIPTGVVATAQTRSRITSYDLALKDITKRVDASAKTVYNNDLAHYRKNQVGSGMRGDKIRTYRLQDNRVSDHRTNKDASCNTVLKGNFDLLW